MQQFLNTFFVSTVTIISGVIMLILFLSELQYYLTKEVRTSTSPHENLGCKDTDEIVFEIYWQALYHRKMLHMVLIPAIFCSFYFIDILSPVWAVK